MKACGPVLYYSPGDVAVIILESSTLDITEPKIKTIFNPAQKQIQGFPAPMYQLSQDLPGIYIAKFQF